MECRRVKAEHKVFKGQPREGGGQSTLSEYKRGIVEIRLPMREGHQITTEPEGATTCINYFAFKFCMHVFFFLSFFLFSFFALFCLVLFFFLAFCNFFSFAHFSWRRIFTIYLFATHPRSGTNLTIVRSLPVFVVYFFAGTWGRDGLCGYEMRKRLGNKS